MLGIGIIGAGFFGESHAKAINNVPSTQLITASRRDKKELKKFTQEFNIHGYTDYKKLLNDKDIDVVVIATPHQEHTQIAVDSASSGKHILIEKPMATSIADCAKIIEAAKKANVKLMVGHIMQFMRSSVVAKKIIDSGELGNIVYGTSATAKKWMSSSRKEWHCNDPDGGGMLITVGIHNIDMLTWLFKSRVSSVKASISTRFHNQQADDAGMLTLQYENGATGMAISTGYDSGTEIFMTSLTCTKGMLNIDMFKGVYLGRNEKWTHLPESVSDQTEHEALVNEWKAFVKAIETDSTPQITGEYGKHMMEIVLAAKRSSMEKKEIWIKDTGI